VDVVHIGLISSIPFRKKLFGGTVPPNNKQFGGTVPPNNMQFGGTLKKIKSKVSDGYFQDICIMFGITGKVLSSRISWGSFHK
jgi:hypothetical protein